MPDHRRACACGVSVADCLDDFVEVREGSVCRDRSDVACEAVQGGKQRSLETDKERVSGALGKGAVELEVGAQVQAEGDRPAEATVRGSAP
jgi:hypothetical protein